MQRLVVGGKSEKICLKKEKIIEKIDWNTEKADDLLLGLLIAVVLL